MNTTRTLMLAALLAIGVAQVATAQTPAPNAAERAVEATYRRYIDRFNAHDLPGFLAGFDPALEMYTPGGWVREPAAVRARYVETFARFPNVRIAIDRLRARQITPTVVLVDFDVRTFPTGEGAAYPIAGTGVYRLADGQWREVLEHETLVRPAAPPPR